MNEILKSPQNYWAKLGTMPLCVKGTQVFFQIKDQSIFKKIFNQCNCIIIALRICLLIRTGSQVSNVAHWPLVLFFLNFVYFEISSWCSEQDNGITWKLRCI